jgi:ankyrin repeat protein
MKKNIMAIITLGLMIANGLIFMRYKDQQAVEAPHANRSLVEVVRNGTKEDVQQLISSGADVHEKDPESGWTPLHQAAATGAIEIAELLIQHGADVNEKSKPTLEDEYAVDVTPLHVAAHAGHLPMVQYLVEHGADVNAVQDKTPWIRSGTLHEAVEGGSLEVIAYLLDHGATTESGAWPIIAEAAAHKNNDILALLLSRGYDVNEPFYKDDLTPLMFAVRDSHIDQIRYLLEHHANPQLEDTHGHTALYFAIQRDDKEIEQLLVAHGATSNHEITT